MTKNTEAAQMPAEKKPSPPTSAAEAAADVAEELARTVDGELRRLESLLSGLDKKVGSLWGRRPTRVKQLSLRYVVDYFVKQRPLAPGAVAAAAIRRPDGDDRYLVRLFFLDADGKPIQGTAPVLSMQVGGFDDELTRTFGANDLIILS